MVDEQGMPLRVEVDGPAAIVLHGDFDESDVDGFCAVIETLGLSATSDLVIDATELEFIGSAGLRALLRARQQAGTVTIRNPPSMLRRTLAVTATDSLFTLDT